MNLALAIWGGVFLAKGTAAAATFRSRLDRGLLSLRWYMFLAMGGDVAEYVTLQRFGYRSLEYKYAYYASDLAVAVLGFFVLVRLVEHAFERTSLKLPRLRTGAMLLFSGVATCSAALVYMMRGGFTTSALTNELEQNLAFLGMVLAILLWIGMNVMRVPGVRFRRVVLAFSLLYSSDAIAFSLVAILPRSLDHFVLAVVPFTGLAAMAIMALSLLLPESAPRAARQPRSVPSGAPQAQIASAS